MTTAASAVISPSGKVHAVRGRALATACGLDYTKRSRRGPTRFLGWVNASSSFDQLVQRAGSVCLNCQENLHLGTGPMGDVA